MKIVLDMMMGADAPHTPGCDEWPPPRRAPRGGFNYRSPGSAPAPPCPARCPASGEPSRKI